MGCALARKYNNVGLELLTAVLLKIQVICDVMLT